MTAAVRSEAQAALDSLKALTPGAELLKVRANPRDWNQAEVLGAYMWGPYPDAAIRPLDGRADDSIHAALTIGAFLASWRHLPVVRASKLGNASHTYLIELTRPHWEG